MRLWPAAARRLALAVVALLLLPAPAGAQLRGLSETGTPVLAGDRVYWGEPTAGALRVRSAPVAGGEGAPFGSLPLGAGDGFRLAAGQGRVAAVVRDTQDFSAPGRLYVAGADGVFAPVASDVGPEPIEFRSASFVQLTARGVFTLERPPVLREGGRPETVTLPPEADGELVATAGGLGLASAQGVLIVFDLRSGTEIRQVGLGRFEDETLNGLSLSPGGDVAATVPAGDGSDVLLYASAGEDFVRVLATGSRFEGVATAGGRVAYINGSTTRDGVRVSVRNGDGSLAWHGPWAADVSALGFDGRNVAFRTGLCGYAGPVGAWEPRLPAGACVRSDATVEGALERRRFLAQVACVNAPGDRCHVALQLRTPGGASAGRARGDVRRGGSKRVPVALNARGRRTPRDQLRLTVRVIDPDGRSQAVALG